MSKYIEEIDIGSTRQGSLQVPTASHVFADRRELHLMTGLCVRDCFTGLYYVKNRNLEVTIMMYEEERFQLIKLWHSVWGY